MKHLPRPLLTAILALLPGCALAQTCAPGELRVFVVDSESGPVFDADVRLTSGTQSLRQSSTLSLGAVDFADLPCGSINVSASKQGFDPSSGDVSMTSAARAQITLTLRPQAQRSSVDVTDTAAPIEQAASQSTEVRLAEVKTLPTNPATVSEILPLIPGIVKFPDGELKIDGSGEQRSALVINQSDVTDPATGKFGQTIPVDSIESVNVLTTPSWHNTAASPPV